MDRDRAPSLIYWTGVWEPSREAISKEVSTLRRALAPRAPVISFSRGQRSQWSGDRVVRLSERHWLGLRALALALERVHAFSHVFGALSAWHFLRALGQRPIVFTVALPGPFLERSLYDKVTLFAVECQALGDALLAHGIDRARVQTIYPGVDLTAFRPSAAPAGRFRIVFASSPAEPNELERRGLRILVDAARLRPEVDIVLRFREWGDRTAMDRALQELRLPPNVHFERGDVSDMASVYRSAHATVCYFEEGFGKSAPNSILEGLACGRPSLVADTCGIAGEIEEWGAGIATPRSATALAAAVDRLRDDYAAYAERARAAAERELGVERFCRQYAELYRGLERG